MVILATHLAQKAPKAHGETFYTVGQSIDAGIGLGEQE